MCNFSALCNYSLQWFVSRSLRDKIVNPFIHIFMQFEVNPHFIYSIWPLFHAYRCGAGLKGFPYVYRAVALINMD